MYQFGWGTQGRRSVDEEGHEKIAIFENMEHQIEILWPLLDIDSVL